MAGMGHITVMLLVILTQFFASNRAFFQSVNNSVHFVVLKDISPNQNCNKHNNHLSLAAVLFCSSHSRKRIDKRWLAFLLLFCVRSLGK